MNNENKKLENELDSFLTPETKTEETPSVEPIVIVAKTGLVESHINRRVITEDGRELLGEVSVSGTNNIL